MRYTKQLADVEAHSEPHLFLGPSAFFMWLPFSWYEIYILV